MSLTVPPKPGADSPAWAPWLIYVHDMIWAAIVTASYIIVRYHFEPRALPLGMLERATASYAAICAFVFPAFRLHRGIWRYTALNDVVRVFQAVAIASLIQLPLLFLVDRLADFPRTTPLFVIPILTVCMVFGRLLRQAITHGDWRAVFRLEDRSLPTAVVVGTTPSVSDYLRTSRRRDRQVRVAGIVTLDETRAGRTIQGVEVMGGLSRLGPVLKSLSAAEDRSPQVILAERRPGRDIVEAVLAAASEVGVQVVSQGAGGLLRPARPSALLDRRARSLNLGLARMLVAGKRVLVTGAGGTIGGELSRQILALGPERLVLFDASEFNLYAIDQQLKEDGAPPVWVCALGDVRDQRRLEVLFAEERPEVVLHAAALKHVPLMETNPCETVLTNVVGAANVARLAAAHSDALVFISTDKAVNPTNVMGATKRVAERVVQAIARGGKAKVAVVRFGNVLGSTGSVVPLFERQIAAGGPITLTHPDVVRFFMTIREAASLVIQAAALPPPDTHPGSSQIYVLDMGEPVKIADLASQMIRLHGLRPGVDIEIVHTGLRPGEKLYEEIFYDAETVRPTGADGVLAAFDTLPLWEDLEPKIAALRTAAESRDEVETIRQLGELEPAFKRA
jgi:O-antigen biosynthesis protein WbqV